MIFQDRLLFFNFIQNIWTVRSALTENIPDLFEDITATLVYFDYNGNEFLITLQKFETVKSVLKALTDVFEAFQRTSKTYESLMTFKSL